MSRSKRKTPIQGITNCRSNKRFKKHEHGAERSKVKCLLKQDREDLPHPKEYGNEWNSPRDGKVWFGYPSVYYLYSYSLKEWIQDFKKWMRK